VHACRSVSAWDLMSLLKPCAPKIEELAAAAALILIC
jgi:hypothetical protein